MAQLPRPAAVDVAAVKEDCAAWEDALDIDDSDLRLSPPPSSRPLGPGTAADPHPDKPSRPSHGQRIPGPASAVQDAMFLRDSGVSPVLGRADAQAADADFLLHPWLCALQFIGKDRAWERPGIKRIKADRELHRAPLVVGVVTSCKPNGLGDLLLTLKDPTDSIGATVHRKVLEGNVGQDISVGCVILLNKVAVFRPSHTACYLNITKGKVVKVVRKDCDPSIKEDISSGTIKSMLRRNIFEVSCDDYQRTLDSSNRTSAHKSSSSADEHPKQSFSIRSTCSQPIPGGRSIIPGDRACTQASNNEKQMLPFAGDLMLPSSKKLKPNAVFPNCYDVTMNTSIDTKSKHGSENSLNTDEQDMAEPFHGSHSSTSKFGDHQQKDIRAANTGTAQPTKEWSAIDSAANNRLLLSQPKTVISVAPVDGWTDEQLSELFAD